jgi:hypothetical protein
MLFPRNRDRTIRVQGEKIEEEEVERRNLMKPLYITVGAAGLLWAVLSRHKPMFARPWRARVFCVKTNAAAIGRPTGALSRGLAARILS